MVVDKVDYDSGFTPRTAEEIKNFCNTLWNVRFHGKEIEVHEATSDYARFTVSQMYEFVELDFRILKAVADFFTTLDVRTNQDSYRGCNTCDYGSSYEVTFTVGKEGG